MESPFMKTFRDFSMADPEDCDQVWDAYLAVVNRKDNASGSSPTTSTSPLHHRPRISVTEAMTPSATTRSTALLRVSGGAVSTTPQTTSTLTCTRNLKPANSSVLSASSDLTRDDLSPGARRIYDYLVGATSDVSTVLHPPPEVEDVLVASVPTTCSAECPSKDVYTFVPVIISSTTPNSSTITGVVIPDLVALVVSDEALLVDVTSLAALPPANCSVECPSNDASLYAAALIPSSVPLSVLISPATQTSSTTIGDVLSELSAPTAGYEALGDTPPIDAICLQGVSNHSIENEDHEALFPTPWSSPASFNAPEASPSTFFVVSACGDGLDADDTSAEEMFLDSEGMCPTVPVSSEVSTFQPLKLFSDCRLCAFVQWTSLLGIFVSLPMEFLEHDNQLQCKEVNKLMSIPVTANQATCWTGNPPISQVWTVLQCNLNGSFSLEHLWDPGIDLLPVDELWHGCTSVDKLEPPIPPTLGMCMTLPMGNAAFGCHSCALVVGFAPVPLQFEMLTVAKFPAMMYLFAHAATLCHYFPNGNLILCSTAAKQSNTVQYLKESQATHAPDCVVSAVYLKFFSLGMVVIFSPGFYEGQVTHMFSVMKICYEFWSLFQCCPAGKACLYDYGAVQLQ